MEWIPHKVAHQIHIENFFSLFKAKYENGFAFPGETHNFWECLYVLDGSVCVSGDERIYNLTEGSIIFHKPLELHKFYIDSKNGAELLIFSFTLEGALSDYLKNKVFSLNSEQKNIIFSMLGYIQVKTKEADILPDTPLHQIYLKPSENSPIYLQVITACIYQLFLSLADNGNIAFAMTTPEAQIFRCAVSHMSGKIDGNPAVSEIAKVCGTSASSLKRIFAQFAGMSVHRYFLKMKFNAATKLLQNGMNVNETAEKLGFSSQSYFSVAYKRETGLNPSQLSLTEKSCMHKTSDN